MGRFGQEAWVVGEREKTRRWGWVACVCVYTRVVREMQCVMSAHARTPEGERLGAQGGRGRWGGGCGAVSLGYTPSPLEATALRGQAHHHRRGEAQGFPRQPWEKSQME